MSRKTFFAAFAVDEDSYTHQPCPVDHHVVATDLAQSSFGEQPGVSNIIGCNSTDDLVADHRRQGPITVGGLTGDQPTFNPRFQHAPEACPSNHWNRGDDICADCGADLGTANNDLLAPPTAATPSFRDQLSPTSRDRLAFEYYEVRPCIERDGQVASYTDEGDYAAELVGLQSWGEEFRTFWTIFGVDAGTRTVIGDFVSRDAAHEVMNAILAVPTAARNAINAALPVRRSEGSRIEHIAGRAADWLEDMINQSSNGQRI